jgi:hypothetical protein
MKRHRLAREILFAALIFPLVACGGSGSQSGGSLSDASVSGVAATGAPIVGTVTLKDSNGLLSGPVSTDSEGRFSLATGGLTPPYLLKVEWTTGAQTQALFSATMEAGSVHINPLTHLALALATGSDPATLFGATGTPPDTTRISKATLTAAVGQIRTLLTPLLMDYGITDFDPLNGHYVATPANRLDAMLDVITIKTENGQVTISNRLTGTAIASGSASNLAGISLDQTRAPNSAVLGDIGELTGRIGAMGATMKLGETLTAAALEGFFLSDPAYGTSGGHTRAQDLASIVEIFGPGGSNTNGPLKELRNLRLVSDLSEKYSGRGVTKVYLLNYEFKFENGKTVQGNNVTFGKETATGLWKFIGDPTGEAAGSNYGCVDINFSVNYGGFVSGNYGNYGSSGTMVVGGWGSPSNPYTSDDLVSGSWKIVKSGSFVQISYLVEGDYVPCAVFNVDTSSLRLRYGAASGWSPAALLKPAFQGDKAAYQGAPVTAQWQGPQSGTLSGGTANGVTIGFQWDEGNGDRGEGFAQISPPGNDTLSVQVITSAVSAPSRTTRFGLLTLITDPLPVDQLATRSVIIGSQTFSIPTSGPFIEPPLSGAALTWNSQAAGASAPGIAVSFMSEVTMTGQAVAASPNTLVRLYAESTRYDASSGVAWGGYTLTVKP